MAYIGGPQLQPVSSSLLPCSSSSMEGAAGEATAGAGPVLPPRPAEFDDLFTDERWALMSEEARRAIFALVDEEQPCTPESPRLHDELFVGGGFPPSPLLLPDDFEGPMESLGQPWRISTDWELQPKKREMMMQFSGPHIAAADYYDADDEGGAKRRRMTHQ